MTPLETIQSRVQRRLDDEWIVYFFDKAVDFHCRKGTRSECDCSYCMRKNSLSVKCGSFANLWQEYKQRFDPHHRPVGISYGDRYDRFYQQNSVDQMRELVKNEAKIELENLRQDVLYQ